MRPIDRKINGLIVKFLARVYPGGLTDQFIAALLYQWRIFVSRERLHRDHLAYLMDRGYVEPEPRDSVVLGRIEGFRLTEKGMLLYRGEDADPGVEIPEGV